MPRPVQEIHPREAQGKHAMVAGMAHSMVSLNVLGVGILSSQQAGVASIDRVCAPHWGTPGCARWGLVETGRAVGRYKNVSEKYKVKSSNLECWESLGRKLLRKG